MNTKITKRSLLMSGLTLLVSVALLASTTFAWFTVSITNGGNQIQSGELQVDMLMADADGKYSSIVQNANDNASAGSIFSSAEGGNGHDWKPGRTETVYLAVKNSGSLAMDYQVKMDVEDRGLADVLEYAVIKDTQAQAAQVSQNSAGDDWANFTQADKKQMSAGRQVILSGEKLTGISSEEQSGGITYFALVVHMNDSADETTYAGDSVNIDIIVDAKQSPVEKDGFGNAGFDGETEYVTPASTADEFMAAISAGADANIVVTQNIDIDDEITISGNRNVTIDISSVKTNDQGVESNKFTVTGGGHLTVDGDWQKGGRTCSFRVPEVICKGKGSVIDFNNIHFGFSSGSGDIAITASDGGTVNISSGYYSTSGDPSTVVKAAGGTVIITGGIFRGNGNQGSVFDVTNGGTIIIDKDVYENDVSQTTHMIIPDTCQAVLEGDNYVITEKTQ